MVCSSTLTLRTGRLVLHSYKDSLAGNTVHVYASARFEIVKVNKTVLRYEVDDAMLLRYLHSHWEVVGSRHPSLQSRGSRLKPRPVSTVAYHTSAPD